MRGRIPSLLLLFVGSILMLAPLSVRGQQRPTRLWKTTWGGTEWDDGYAVAVGSDIYIVGETYSYGVGEEDAFLVKYGFPPPVALAPFFINIEPKDGNVRVGDTVTYECKIEASPGFQESITFTITVKALFWDITHNIGTIDPPYPQEFSYDLEIPKEIPGEEVTVTATIIGTSEGHTVQESVKLTISGPSIPGFPIESIIIGLTVGILIIWMMQRRN